MRIIVNKIEGYGKEITQPHSMQLKMHPLGQDALMDQFQQGLCNDVKDLLLIFHEDPKSLTEVISQVV